MTELPDEAGFRREMARVDDDLATARRLIAAFVAENRDAINGILGEVHRSGRGSKVLMAAVIQAADLGRMLMGDDFGAWIDQAAMMQMDIAEQDWREIENDD
jgi:hypothetical protein